MKEKFENAKQNVKGFVVRAKVEANIIARQTAQFVTDNKELIIAMVPVAIACVRTAQTAGVNHRVKAERNRIDHTYYDPSTGMHWELRRKATNSDRAEIIRRKSEGQDTYTILRQMKLIK